MTRAFTKFAAAAASVLLAVVGFVALETPKSADAALSGKMFDPGLIISDSVFYDFGTMTAADIQRFLDSKVETCKATSAGPTCLRHYKMDTQAKAGEDGRCSPLPAKTNQSAAQIIFDVANACKINPRVLLVILQKEQGLVQATNPTPYMYRAALGYGCPDSQPAICGKGSTITGLFNQLYRAAGQLQWYGDPRGSFTYLKVGTNVKVKYQADFCDARNSAGTCTKWVDKCGSKVFQLKSQASAALYYYTPYTPNDAALKNLYGTGDTCSAYGNRNFWRFYSDWFGSTIGGGFLLKSKDSPTYLIVDSTRYEIKDANLVDALKPLGPLGTVSQAYMDSFKDGGQLTPLVQSSTKKLYFVSEGKKYTLASCDLALEIGLDCAKAITLTTSQLNALTTAGGTTTYVPGDGADRYLIDNGEIHEILDAPSIAAANITLPALSKTKISAFKSLRWGAPVASNRTLFTDRATGQKGVYITGQYYRIPPAVAAEIDFGKWFTPSAGSLSPQGLSAVETGVELKPFVKDPDGNNWLISSTGKRSISKTAAFIKSTPEISSSLLSQLPTSGTQLSTPAFVKSTASKTVYFVGDGSARIPVNAADKAQLATYVTDPTTVALQPVALNQLGVGNAIFAPGEVIRLKDSKKLYAVNSFKNVVALQDDLAVEQLALPNARTVKEDALTRLGYTVTSRFTGLKLKCGTTTYVPFGGYLIAVEPSAIAHWPGAAASMGALLCDRLLKDTISVGRFIHVGTAKKFYLIHNGKKRAISATSVYRSLLGTQLPAIEVDQDFANRIPTGEPAPATMPVDGVVVNPPSGGGDGAVTSVKYTVKSGDTLGAIATRYKVTVAAIMAANSLTNANSIKVGQVLTIPKS